LARERKVQTVSGKKIELKVSTICIHGDTHGAPKIARAVFEKLEQSKIAIRPLRQIIE
jgi:5-oxoprolinase (ATP-hydrolysing) subunit A